MKYAKIKKCDVANGPGVRVSLFVSGCNHHCKNCFNPETHDFNGGKEFTDETIEKVLSLCDASHIEGLSILGGEPLHPKNIEASTKLAKSFKEKYPNKNLWLWSGYLYENLLNNYEIINYIDILVDGVYKDELHNPTLSWRGSSNQRVIDVKKSLKNDKIVLIEE